MSVKEELKLTPAPQQQSKLSLWTAVAVAQVIFWLLCMPALVRPHWERIWIGLQTQSPFLSELVLNWTALGVFVIYGLCIFPVYYMQHPFFEQYKIADKPWAWLDTNPQPIRDAFWAQTRKSLKLFAFNIGVLVPVATLAKVVFTPGAGPCFKDSEWPTTAEMVRDNVLLTLIHEFGFYWSHRMMHTPQLYRFHKVHHEYKQNNIFASQHNDPVDHLVSIAAPAVFALTIIKPHSIIHFQWVLWAIYANLDDHVGYSFPWSPVRWFPSAALTEHHEFHHSVNLGCFSSKLCIYDKLFDSEATYIKWVTKRLDLWKAGKKK